ncbi:hypothetical protein BB560_001551 [Smittium megazygosporum]|uniref:Core-binding (CB) domain-containing protein n=1 Tax=Smittium megazygosporum TaxID=133381 RepID=A0A2T9ZHG8_9FUNG|nr:hypothetical protein BB560_001551 [Smittium megazygosporum]
MKEQTSLVPAKFLAQATRPIDSYVHSLLVSEPEIYSEDTRILFASTIRILLSEAATMLIQARIDNLHYGLKLPGKPIQIMENNNEPLLNQTDLNELLASKRAKRSNKPKPFRGRQQHSVATSNNVDTPVENVATDLGKIEEKGKLHSRWTIPSIPKCLETALKRSMDFKNNKTRIQNSVQPPPLLTRKPGPQIGHRDKKVGGTIAQEIEELLNKGTIFKLQDGESKVYKQDNASKGFHGIHRFSRCFPAYKGYKEPSKIFTFPLEWSSFSIQSSTFRHDPITTSFHKDPQTSNALVPTTKNKVGSLLGQYFDHGTFKGRQQDKNTDSARKTSGTWIQSKQQKIISYAITDYRTSGSKNQLSLYDLQDHLCQDQRVIEINKRSHKIKENNFKGFSSCYWKNTGNVNSYITENTDDQTLTGAKEFQPTNMEWKQFPSRSTRVGSLDRFKQIEMENHYRIPSILLGDIPTLNPNTYSSIWSTEEIWGHIIPIATETSRKDMETLFKYWNKATGQLYPINFKSSGCPFTHDYTNRVVIEGRCVQEDPTSTWKERRGPICFSKEQEASKLLFVVPGHRSNCNKFTAPQMANMGKSICLSAMESDTECDSESSPRKAKNDNNHNTLDYSNMVSRITDSISEAATHNSSGCSNSGSQEREVSIRKEQDLVPNGLEHKRKTLSNQGLANQAIKIIVGNTRAAKRLRRYDKTQGKFIAWRKENKLNSAINAADIVNFLAKGVIEDKISFSTVKAYKSALMQLFDDPKSIATTPCFKEFFTALKETFVKSFIRPSYNVTPIINEIITWGPSDKLGISKLTSKLCWFISICGFLCASYINRIDDLLITISNETLKFVIIATKEKYNGQPILKPCEIRSHSNPILCPIQAYKAYKEFTHTRICKKHHPNHQEIELLMLMRHTKDLQKAQCRFHYKTQSNYIEFYAYASKFQYTEEYGIRINISCCIWNNFR